MTMFHVFSSLPSQRQLPVELTLFSNSWSTGRATSTRLPPPQQSQRPPLHHPRSKMNIKSVVEVNNLLFQKLPFRPTDDLRNTLSISFFCYHGSCSTLRYDTRQSMNPSVLVSKCLFRETSRKLKLPFFVRLLS